MANKDNGYLIFKRRAGETIVIHGLVEITINKITDTQVHIAIKAPKEIEIHRKEVLKGPRSKDSPNNNANE